MITRISIHNISNNKWGMSVKRDGQDPINIPDWSDLYPDLTQEILAAAETLKSPEQIAKEKMLLLVEEKATDQEILEISPILPEWKPSEKVSAGQIKTFENKIFRCLQNHTTQVDWRPTFAPSLWVEIGADVAAEKEIVNWFEPDSTNFYALGQLVKFTDGIIYESLLDNNIWSPVAYPAGWKKREDLS